MSAILVSAFVLVAVMGIAGYCHGKRERFWFPIFILVAIIAGMFFVGIVGEGVYQFHGRPIGISSVPSGAYRVLAVAENDTTINALVVGKEKVVRAITLSSGDWRCGTSPADSVAYITTVGEGNNKKKIVTGTPLLP